MILLLYLIYILFYKISISAKSKVLHGCRQFVLWGVCLSAVTNETPLFNYSIK